MSRFEPSQLSVARSVVTTSPSTMVWEMDDTGASTSSTTTVNVQVAVPAAFEATQTTSLVPPGKLNGELMGEPLSVHAISGAGRPVAATEKSTSAEHRPGSLVAVMFTGQEVKTGSAK